MRDNKVFFEFLFEDAFTIAKFTFFISEFLNALSLRINADDLIQCV